MALFDPLPRSIGTLGPDDLAGLSNVAEGWYVEYKREVPSVPSIAKSISAFANHYGGWIFYGIEEQDRLPASYSGVPSTAANALVDRIRDAARTFIQPVPHFDVQVVSGPSTAIGLGADRSIIAVRVPPGFNPPYIHGHGRIYRRVADSSDPKHETDRAVLDELYRRARRSMKELQKRLSYVPILSKGEEAVSYLQVFLFHEALQEESAQELTHDEFAAEMKQRGGSWATIPFEASYPSSSGFVARQVTSADAGNRSLTWEYDLDAFHSITIPIPRVDSQRDTRYLHVHDFIALVPQLLQINILDLTLLLGILAGCLDKYLRLAEITKARPPFMFKSRLINVWRTVPFVDTAAYLKSIKEYGLPIVQYARCFAPADQHGLTLVPFDNGDSEVLPQVRTLTRAIGPFMRVMEGVGAPTMFTRAHENLIELLRATERVAATHRGPAR